MIVIELEGKEWNLPSGWDEVSVELFEKVVNHSIIVDDYISQVQHTIDLMSIMTGAPKEELNKMTRKSFEELSNRLDWLKDDLKPSGKKTFMIGDEEYIAIDDFDNLSMGDSASMELIIKESNETNILGNLLPLLVRKSKKIYKDGGKTKIVPEDFEASEYEKTKAFLKSNMMVSDVMHLKSFF